MPIPITLEDALRAGRVIPFVGAGVSMAVLDRGTGQPLFPSWAELLGRAADRLDQEDRAPYAAVVRNLLRFNTPDYLDAARRAREGLGPVWFTFLKEHLDYPRERADDASLRLAQSLWALGSPLLITTNYDRVLQWACPQRDDLVPWDIEAPAEQVEVLRGEVRRPTVWHLHGQINNVARVILTPDGYRRLYPDDGAVEGRHQAALATLRSLMTSKVFLFVGFSLDDDYVTHQLRSIEDLFQGATGPHYVLVQESARDRVRGLHVPSVEVITFPAFGEPLVECLHELGRIVTPTGSPVEVPERLPEPPGEPPQPSVFDPHHPSSRTPGRSRRGISDMLHCPPADRDYELQFFDRLVTGRTSERIWLLEADTGMGKTTLLHEFVRHCPSEMACVPIDLKGGISGLHEIFYRLCDGLGWDHFPTVQARVESLGQAAVQTNTLISHADIAVALRTPDQGDRLTRRAELTRAFFDDLRPWKRRLLIIFDTFDDAAPDVQEWLQGSFLALARRTSHLVVIVAGRRVPEDSIEWATCCIRHRLIAVCEPEPWQRYADRRGAVFQSHEWIAAFCDLLGGHPLQMAEAIARYIPRGG